ncbi:MULTISPECIES: Gp49 family protein [Bacillus cereus group]|uniref:Gp49 family protein n=1 Tax=Bacillus cereus group TaxID=86661 RepID=UPI002DB7F40C|nr:MULTISPECIES: Gp49 family protein [Bacillus cereus group]
MKSTFNCNLYKKTDTITVDRMTREVSVEMHGAVRGERWNKIVILTPQDAAKMGKSLQSLAADLGHSVPCTTDTVEVASKEPLQTKVTAEQIDDIMKKAKVLVSTEFEKCTVVTVKLPNGFTITESSGCVDVANYDVKLGTEICLKKIRNKVWELEGYALQKRLSDMGVM